MLNIQDYHGNRRSIPPAAEAIWPLLEEGVRLNLSRPAPDLFSSGVVYRREARVSGQTPDTFLPWWRVLPIGAGDCEDLSAWAAAQYRRRGDSSARVGLVEFPAGGWHAVVLTSRRPRLPSDPAVWPVEHGRYASARVYGGPDVGWDPAGWWVIDPSYSLGMRDPATPTLYHPQTLAGEREPRIAGPAEDEPEPVNRRKLYLSLGIGALATAALVASLTRHPVDYAGPLPWRALWGKYAGFEPAVRRVARQLGTDPRFLLAVMRKESRFDPKIENPWGYVGLIQFGPAARTELGVTKEQVLAMTPAQQVELARRYYWPYRGKLNTLADLYMATFLPAYLGQSADAIIAARGSKRAKNNPSLDHDGDGQISYWEPGASAAALLQEEEDRMRAAGELTAAPAVAGPDLAGLERQYLDRLDASASVPQIAALLAQLRAEPGTESLYGIIDRRIALFQRPDYAGTLEDARVLARNIVRQLTLSTTYDPGVMQTLSHAATAVVTAPAELVRSAASAAENVVGWQGWGLWPLAALAAVGLYVWRRS